MKISRERRASGLIASRVAWASPMTNTVTSPSRWAYAFRPLAVSPPIRNVTGVSDPAAVAVITARGWSSP